MPESSGRLVIMTVELDWVSGPIESSSMELINEAWFPETVERSIFSPDISKSKYSAIDSSMTEYVAPVSRAKVVKRSRSLCWSKTGTEIMFARGSKVNVY